MALIAVTNLTKTYNDGTTALRGVTFSIEKGEFVAIMGPSGSGKSTLLHILGFLDRPTSGTYQFEGKTIDDFEGDALAHVRNREMGFVFQAFNLLPHTDVYDNVIMPLYYSNVPESLWREKAVAAIDVVGLTARIEHESHELSGGEKQRVAIARALINDPNIIFADEPTGNLDTAAGEAIVEVLTALHEGGRTVVLITHSEDLARHADRMLTIRDGLLAADDSAPHPHHHEHNHHTPVS